MKGYTLTVRVDGTEETQEHDKPLPLYFLQGAVGGYIQMIPGLYTIVRPEGRRECYAFCNEEGKLRGLAPNAAAMRIWEASHAAIANDDILAGDIIIVWGDDAFMRGL